MSSHVQNTLEAVVNFVGAVGIDAEQFNSEMSVRDMMSALIQNVKYLATPTTPGILRLPNEVLMEIAKSYYDNNGCLLAPGHGETNTHALSLVSKLFREITLPFVFKKMRIVCDEDDLQAHLEDIEHRSVILGAVSHLDVRVTTAQDFYAFPPALDDVVSVKLATVIKNMGHLSELKLQLQSFNGLAAPFFQELILQDADMSRVTTLLLGSDTPLQHIVPTFSNVKVMSCQVCMPVSQYPDFEDSLKQMPLTHLRLIREGAAWRVEELEEVADALYNHPTLESLEIQKQLSFVRVGRAIMALRRMTKLKELVLTCQQTARRVNMEDFPIPNLRLAMATFPNLHAAFFTRDNGGYRCGLARAANGRPININVMDPVPAWNPQYWGATVPALTINWAENPVSNWIPPRPSGNGARYFQVADTQTAGNQTDTQTAGNQTDSQTDSQTDNQTDNQIVGNQAVGVQTTDEQNAGSLVYIVGGQSIDEQTAGDQGIEGHAAQ